MPMVANLYYHAYREADRERLPVVLIHGAGGSHLHWPSRIRRLAAYRVYAPDLPGHGKSGGFGGQSIQSYVQALLEWLEEIGLTRAVFVGHSMGSAIAQVLALEHSDQVLALGLVGSASRLRVAPQLIEYAAHPTSFHKAVETIANWSYSPTAPPELVALALKRMREVRPSVLYGDLLACDAYDQTERIGDIHQPTLIVCGQEDRMTPVRNSLFLADHLARSQLCIIPAAGHMVMLEQPQVVEEALLGFLAHVEY